MSYKKKKEGRKIMGTGSDPLAPIYIQQGNSENAVLGVMTGDTYLTNEGIFPGVTQLLKDGYGYLATQVQPSVDSGTARGSRSL
jgi:hypothetical protein